MLWTKERAGNVTTQTGRKPEIRSPAAPSCVVADFSLATLLMDRGLGRRGYPPNTGYKPA